MIENLTEFYNELHEQANIIENQQCTIELPPQTRCLSHLLNLISSDFEKALDTTIKNMLFATINKMHALWALTRRSSQVKTVVKEVIGCTLLLPCETRWNLK